ncbi:beta-phosphoglucomutase [Mesomycoplasma neurolyticum]|uniref:Beta-phosphoglucomutase n=1 Tax=Mesomycoplasma neurolyticum TaxID=2120 RepID=A0A449A570_9BACT|nr:beta-phosphoglucomutase [Mesomycoplasma neurolyticum]VEU59411.1 beta-phosphoglucomutase (beta-PGM) domain-containing protein [Mesomycoplasma neurolyticum]
MFKGIIFDLDGVITETAIFHYLAWKHEVAKLNIIFTKEENDKLKGLSRIDTLKAILKFHNKKMLENDILKLADSKNKYYKELLDKQLNTSHILKGIKKFINAAKKQNIKLAIASSSQNAKFILEKLQLLNYFDFIVDPKTIKKGKPNKEIFIKACQGLQLKTNEVIGIEDSYSGIEALNKAKIFSVAIVGEQQLNWSNANVILKSTNELNLKKLFLAFKK